MALMLTGGHYHLARMEPATAFLQRLGDLADATPCVIQRDDLLRLLALAGLAETHLSRVIAAGSANTLTTDRTGLLAAIEAAREAE